jgi:hypothetical protein
MAERIVEAYKSGSLEIHGITLDKLLLLKKHVLQVRQNVVNVDKVSEIVGKVRVTKSTQFIDPILVIQASPELLKLNDLECETSKSALMIVNGNHTSEVNAEVIRKKIVDGYTEAPIVIIPADMLPELPEDQFEVLKLVAVIMNKVEKIVQGMTKNDIKHLIVNDLVSGKDITDPDYQEVLAEAATMSLYDIRTLVSKARQESLNQKLNRRFNFKQYSVAEMNEIKFDREGELGFDTEVTWAVVTPDKTYETLGKAIGNMLQNDCSKAHIIFHFKNYDDVKKLKSSTEEKIEKFQKTSKIKINYEFLPWNS